MDIDKNYHLFSRTFYIHNAFKFLTTFISLERDLKKGLFFVSNEYYTCRFSKHEVPN